MREVLHVLNAAVRRGTGNMFRNYLPGRGAIWRASTDYLQYGCAVMISGQDQGRCMSENENESARCASTARAVDETLAAFKKCRSMLDVF
jgi:hypothetical protein